MNDRRRFLAHVLHTSPAALLFATLLLTTPAPVLASCLPLDLAAIPRTTALVVFSGTVESVDGSATRVRIDRWFSGSNPAAVVTVSGGRGSTDPKVVTSADWAPVVGKSYLVVAQRDAAGRLTTEACMQARADDATLASAKALFGSGAQPAVAPGSPATDEASRTAVSSQLDPRLAIALVATAAALLLLGVRLITRQRRSLRTVDPH